MRVWRKVRYRPQATDINMIRRTHIECWIIKATDTHLEYVNFIMFPRQQWLGERVSLLRLYVHCRSCFAWPQTLLFERFNKLNVNTLLEKQWSWPILQNFLPAVPMKMTKALKIVSIGAWDGSSVPNYTTSFTSYY